MAPNDPALLATTVSMTHPLCGCGSPYYDLGVHAGGCEAVRTEALKIDAERWSRTY